MRSLRSATGEKPAGQLRPGTDTSFDLVRLRLRPRSAPAPGVSASSPYSLVLSARSVSPDSVLSPWLEAHQFSSPLVFSFFNVMGFCFIFTLYSFGRAVWPAGDP